MKTIRDEDTAGGDRQDERLDAAFDLLQTPPRVRLPGVVPLLAGCAFIGAATLLAYVYTKNPMISATPGKPATTARHAEPASKADFEISSTAGETVTEAIPLGSESAR
ncbi:MAG: hypothetical protein QM647_17020 [Asticcacaulis sp.]|uniref:hypothetical protein n=1 Tax=Asticcacaulis sp. TaxID=1872648 RepID=UPI0039E3E99D